LFFFSDMLLGSESASYRRSKPTEPEVCSVTDSAHSLIVPAAPRAPAADDPEASIAIFFDEPQSAIIDEFRQFLIATGKPDEWQYHARSKPRPDERFEIICHAVIPEKLRGKVPMATCPICSPDKPKYFEGALAWFPGEGKLRAIGIDCAAGHFGEQVMREAERRYREKRDEKLIFEDVEKQLKQIDRWLDQFKELQTAANASDTFVGRLTGIVPMRVWESIFKSPGGLTISEIRKVTKSRRDGSTFEVDEPVEVWRHLIEGAPIFQDRSSIGKVVSANITTLTQMAATDHDVLLARMYETRKLLHESRDALSKVRERVREVVRFVHPSNLGTIATWANDSRVTTSLRLQVIDSDAILLGNTRVEVPKVLRDPPSMVRPASVHRR
jgi:hypothetical protein